MEASDTGFNTPSARTLLARELVGLPLEVAQEADVFTLAMLAATWLDADDRIRERADRELEDAGAAR